jgi:hypothetical protein
MKEFPMPVGEPTYFEGDIRQNPNLIDFSVCEAEEQSSLKRPFGFFEVEITTPEDILNPILQTKLGLHGRFKRTLAPIGT